MENLIFMTNFGIRLLINTQMVLITTRKEVGVGTRD